MIVHNQQLIKYGSTNTTTGKLYNNTTFQTTESLASFITSIQTFIQHKYLRRLVTNIVDNVVQFYCI